MMAKTRKTLAERAEEIERDPARAARIAKHRRRYEQLMAREPETLRYQVLAQSEAIHGILDPAGAETIWLIGSVARAEERPDSDIDFLVVFRRGTTLGDLAQAEAALEEVFHRHVDVISDGGLRKGDEATFWAGAIAV
jgi:predicted nucleotidyltransferase